MSIMVFVTGETSLLWPSERKHNKTELKKRFFCLLNIEESIECYIPDLICTIRMCEVNSYAEAATIRNICRSLIWAMLTKTNLTI